MQGLEFMVTHDPSEGDTKPVNSGVWVIRKQNRRKRLGMQDELTGISSYYVVGENIYMAPSVGNIISSRLVSHNESYGLALVDPKQAFCGVILEQALINRLRFTRLHTSAGLHISPSNLK